MFEIPRSVDEFCREVSRVADQGDRSAALQMVVDLVQFTIASETSIAQVLSSREVDETCLRLGKTSATVDGFDPDQTVFLVTYLSQSGGHTRVLRDLVGADPGKRTTILVSNVQHHADAEELRDTLGDAGVDVQVAPSGLDLDAVVIWTQQWLAKLRAERAYILQHSFDATIPASVQPSLVKTLFYIHNCDHSFALGVHIPHAVHVDLHPKGFHLCRGREDISNNVCWPLVVTPTATRPIEAFGDKVQRTCTSGGREKFGSAHLTEQTPYLLNYPDTVATILATTGGVHFHVGGLTKEILAEIHDRLDLSKINLARFIHVDFVPGLADFFLSHDIDLYVGSMPWGGGRALIEAMSAGLPVLIHSNYRSALLTDQNEAYPGALLWRKYDDLSDKIRQLDHTALKWHAEASRSFFQAGHSPEMLANAIEKTLHGQALSEPPVPHHVPDALQTFLDERAASAGQIRVDPRDLTRRDEQVRNLEAAFRTAEQFALERLAQINSQNDQLRDLDSAFQTAERFALERLAQIQELDRQLKLADAALVSITSLAAERQTKIDAMQAELKAVSASKASS